MFEPLFSRLAGRYRLIAPDYPGFGHSDAPDPASFAYTFDHIAEVVDHFTQVLNLDRYSLYLQDYGGPVGFRVALEHPERVQTIIVQNAVAHEIGLGPLWSTRRAFWADRAGHEAAFRENFLSLAATQLRHVGTNPDPSTINPDRWTDEFAFLNLPGEGDIQTDLFYDYRTNVASYPKWQEWLQRHQPPLLVVWGKWDTSFQVAEADAYRHEISNAEVHVIDAGHFATYDDPDTIAQYVRNFLNLRLQKA
jgi:pimeloyl-ACP methyl ester carboxylesterase